MGRSYLQKSGFNLRFVGNGGGEQHMHCCFWLLTSSPHTPKALWSSAEVFSDWHPHFCRVPREIYLFFPVKNVVIYKPNNYIIIYIYLFDT